MFKLLALQMFDLRLKKNADFSPLEVLVAVAMNSFTFVKIETGCFALEGLISFTTIIRFVRN